MTKVIAQTYTPKRHPTVSFHIRQGTCKRSHVLVHLNSLMIEAEGRDDMKGTQPENILGKERLVIRAAILIEASGVAFVVAVRKQIRANELLEGGFAMIDHATKGQSAATEHGVIAPELAHAQVNAPVVVVLRLNGGGARQFAIWSQRRSRPVIHRLVGEPGFTLK